VSLAVGPVRVLEFPGVLVLGDVVRRLLFD
jgi:hypothetical protein